MSSSLPHVLNLSNSIIGVTILAMPFCFRECGIVLGMLLLLFCTWLTLVSCHLLMKAGVTSRRKSYGFLAYYTYGAVGKLAVELGMIGLQVGTLIAQVVVIGDLGPTILSKFTGLENNSNLRTGFLAVMCLCVGLPLGLLKNLHAISRASSFCICFYCFFTIYVMFLSGPNLYAGDWVHNVQFWRTDGLFKCLPIFSFAFGCQTQLFLLYDSLPDPSLSSVNSVVKTAVNLCTVLYLLTGFFGYVAFNSKTFGGNIIRDFDPSLVSDLLILGFVLSIAVSFPLIIYPCRSSLYALLFPQKNKHPESFEQRLIVPEFHFKCITVAIVLGSMIVGILVPNVEFVLAMNGATVGTLICYIFPAVFFLRVMSGSADRKVTAQGVFVIGFLIMVLCTYTNLNTQNQAVSVDLPNKLPLPVQPQELMPDNLPVTTPVGDKEKKQVDQDLENLPPDKEKKADEIAEKRVEPPNPMEPIEVMNDSNDDKKAEENKPEQKKDAEKDKAKDMKSDNKEATEMQESKDEPKDLKKDGKTEGKIPNNKPQNATAATADEKKNQDEHVKKEEESKDKEKKTKDLDEVKKEVVDVKKEEELIAKLEKQQEEQKQLIQEQKQILAQLKEHEKEHQAEKKKLAEKPVVGEKSLNDELKTSQQSKAGAEIQQKLPNQQDSEQIQQQQQQGQQSQQQPEQAESKQQQKQEQVVQSQKQFMQADNNQQLKQQEQVQSNQQKQSQPLKEKLQPIVQEGKKERVIKPIGKEVNNELQQHLQDNQEKPGEQLQKQQSDNDRQVEKLWLPNTQSQLKNQDFGDKSKQQSLNDVKKLEAGISQNEMKNNLKNGKETNEFNSRNAQNSQNKILGENKQDGKVIESEQDILSAKENKHDAGKLEKSIKTPAVEDDKNLEIREEMRKKRDVPNELMPNDEKIHGRESRDLKQIDISQQVSSVDENTLLNLKSNLVHRTLLSVNDRLYKQYIYLKR